MGHARTTTSADACLFVRASARTRLWLCLFVYSDPLLHGFLRFLFVFLLLFLLCSSLFAIFAMIFNCSMFLFVCVFFFLFCFVRCLLFLVFGCCFTSCLCCFVFLLRESFAVLEQCYSTAFILKVTDFFFFYFNFTFSLMFTTKRTALWESSGRLFGYCSRFSLRSRPSPPARGEGFCFFFTSE